MIYNDLYFYSETMTVSSFYSKNNMKNNFSFLNKFRRDNINLDCFMILLNPYIYLYKNTYAFFIV